MGIGIKINVHWGVNENAGIRPKKTPTSTIARMNVPTVAIIGNTALLILRDMIRPLLPVRLISPPEVPLEKIWNSNIPVMR